MTPSTAGLPFELADLHPMVVGGLLVGLAAFVMLAVLLVRVFRGRRARKRAFVSQFGGEYLRALESRRSRRRVEEDLVRRRERRATYELSTLHVLDRSSFWVRWDKVERRFVHGPEAAAQAAVALVVEVAASCGYPGDEEECLDDVSVDHAHLVADLRRAMSGRSRLPDTDRHREVVLRARSLFERLLDVATPGPAPGASPVLKVPDAAREGDDEARAGGSSAVNPTAGPS